MGLIVLKPVKMKRKIKLVGAFLLTDSQQAMAIRQTNITPILVRYTHMFLCTYLDKSK